VIGVIPALTAGTWKVEEELTVPTVERMVKLSITRKKAALVLGIAALAA
jgi:hypothetical protein